MNCNMKDYEKKQSSQATQTTLADISCVFQCDFCSKILKTATKFILHQANHTGEKLFHCKFCVQSFAKPKKLLKHQRTHVEDRPFQCRFCSESFKKPSKLIKHQISHTNEKAIQCRFCLTTLSDPATFVDHVTLHCNGSEDICFSPDKSEANECATEEVSPKETNSSIKDFMLSEKQHWIDQDSGLAVLENSDENFDPSLEDLSPPTLEPICSTSSDANLEKSEEILDSLSDVISINQLSTPAANDTTSECSFSYQAVTSQNREQVLKIGDTSVFRSSKDSNKECVSNPELNKGGKCTVCDKEFASKYYLTIHAKIHSNDRPFKCMICEKRFLHSANLKSHLKSHKTLICCFCDKKCTTPVSFFNHMKFHVQNTEMNCQFCFKTFSNSSEFRAHLLIHKTKDRRKMNDKMPKVQGRKKQSLDASEINSKTLALPQKEDPSGASLIKTKKLINQSSASHQFKQVNGHCKQGRPQNSRNFCLHCKKHFTTPSNLAKHMKLHSRTASFKCSYCKKNFASLASLKMHEKTHSVTRPNICRFCKKTFHSVDLWQNHLKSMHREKSYKCQFCNKLFDHIKKFKLHQKYHLSKTRHSCPICKKIFVYKGSLKSHIADHK